MSSPCKKGKSLRERFLPSQAVGLLCLALAVEGSAMAAEADGVRRVYSHLLEPSEHPDYDRRAVKPPTSATFKNRTQFTCLCGFSINDDWLVGCSESHERVARGRIARWKSGDPTVGE